MKQTLSTMTAAKIWPASMKMSFDYFGLQPQEFTRPEGLVEREVCGDTRMRPGAPRCWNDVFMAENAPKQTVQAGPKPTVAPTTEATPPPAPPAAPAAQPTARPAQPQPAAKPTAAPAAPAPAQQQPAAKPTVAPAPAQPAPKPTAAPAAPATKPQPTPVRR